jgi:hypothetical protein
LNGSVGRVSGGAAGGEAEGGAELSFVAYLTFFPILLYSHCLYLTSDECEREARRLYGPVKRMRKQEKKADKEENVTK